LHADGRKRADHVDNIGNYLIGKGMDARMAHDIQKTYEVLDVLHHKARAPCWNDDLIKRLIS
jgi:hypothetical protein